ncbi:MAG: YeaH/YhbH family protein [Gammaproteobacteria bacterium]|nr:YeaH/YhbH family protein [Gammaproteobacteria bacterium]MBU0769823.1 YeaH/YhbH family protein [Gammaproteobacteria bacterium]MBU0856436.1 YeaH/YhbH family protein [Gammaproteobacteria bacterium]MBU1847504.1 YeaH/YhbH family protein [Gammaproteobacteria bacterium]
MQQIIDRRLAGKNKSIGNRERFLRRHKEQIRDAVKRAVEGRGIRDIAQGEDIHIPRRTISEPVFGHGQGGRREMVHPGNKDFVRGDRIERPQGGGSDGSGSGQASDSGEGDDDFVFHLTKEEFMQVFFEDLALPNLIRTTLADTPEFKTHRAGFSSDGTPNNLHVVRSMRGAIGRRIALGSESRRELARLEEHLLRLRGESDTPARRHEIEALERDIEALRARIARIPYLDPIDLRYRSRVRTPVPTAKAVMFCLMDVSGSMDEARKDLAKRFFILLYLFLTRHYEKIDIVFIRHHTQAQEVDEHDFFHATETGGTVVSSALVLMEEVIRARYPRGEWNIYGAQASDGDNWHDDSPRCRELLQNNILPLCRYFAYIQVVEQEQNLWYEYAALAQESETFAMRKASEIDQIYPVFRDLFRKEGVAA